jgi:uncharacterized membrane-anchored protein
MRDLKALRNAGIRLREIEARLERVSHEWHFGNRDRELMNVISDLERLSLDTDHGHGSRRMRARQKRDRRAPLRPGALFYRTARARFYYRMMTRLVDDLAELHIANWQTYSQFIRRRLASTLEYVSGFGQRALDLWTLARSRAEFVESRTILKLETMATVASTVLAPLAFLTTAKELEIIDTKGWDWARFGLFYGVGLVAWLTLLRVFVRPRARRFEESSGK